MHVYIAIHRQIQYNAAHSFSHRPSLQLIHFYSLFFSPIIFNFDLFILCTVTSDNMLPINFAWRRIGKRRRRNRKICGYAENSPEPILDRRCRFEFWMGVFFELENAAFDWHRFGRMCNCLFSMNILTTWNLI